jgi:pyrimidine-nucleoside phosphorylase
MLLGAGRATKESIIDLAVGIVLHKKIGAPVRKGESLVTIHSNREDVAEVTEMIYNAYGIVPNATCAPSLIYDEIREK